MPTQIKENYLKALFYLHQKSPDISVTDLGKEMGVSKPTVNNMVKKLEDRGWLNYQKYKPMRLTKEGLRQAAVIVRKHRLSEMFLSQIMGFGWEEVHDMAEELEHLKSEKYFDRMDQLLGFPTKDPHGSPIPDKNGHISDPNYELLSKFDVGDKVILRAIRDSSSEFLHYLNRKDIKLGIEITITVVEDFDQTMSVSYKGHKNEVLSQVVCNSLLVEKAG